MTPIDLFHVRILKVKFTQEMRDVVSFFYLKELGAEHFQGKNRFLNNEGSKNIDSYTVSGSKGNQSFSISQKESANGRKHLLLKSENWEG